MGGFTEAAQGSLVLAIPVALLAGLVSFLSPCVLPLVPGYLSYVTGLSGADAQADQADRKDAAQRARMLAGSLLFVLGFAVVFVSSGLLFGGIGTFLAAQGPLLMRILGVVAIVMGLAFLGWIPFLQRDVRVHKVPSVGLAVAPLLGATFGLGWTPCIGPTLGVVLSLATTQGTAGRGALLMLVYALGLGIPFVLMALGFRWMVGTVAFVKRHQVWVTRIGGGMLIAVGLLLVTGLWAGVVDVMRQWIAGFETVV